MAHPGRYTMTLLEHGALFDEFKDLGGEGVEVVTGSHTPDQYACYADVARRYGLLASRGSDFHGPGEGRVEPGRAAAAAGQPDAGVEPVAVLSPQPAGRACPSSSRSIRPRRRGG